MPSFFHQTLSVGEKLRLSRVMSLSRILQKDKLHNSVCAVQSSEDSVLYLYMGETKLE